MRIALATAWILAFGAITGGIYWAFLSTPESTVWTLFLSATLALLAAALSGLTANGAIALLVHGPSATGLRLAIRWIPAIVVAGVVEGLLWWIAGGIDTWVALRTGEINAWFIARFGWDNVSWFFTAVRWFTLWLRWVLCAVMSLSLLAGMMAVGWRAVAQAAWLRRALRPRTLVVATFWFVVLVLVPWAYLAPWRPQWLPATSAELAFIVVKLSLTSALIALGFALIAFEAVRITPPPLDYKSNRVAAA
jgi:hypothetical protein